MGRLHRRPKSFSDYMPSELEVNGEKAILFNTGQLQIMSKEDFQEMIKLAMRFYESEGVSEWIEKENEMRLWLSHPLMGTELLDDKYISPNPQIEKRKFKVNAKINWGFNCDWCNKKVSNETDTEYYRVHEYLPFNKTIEGRTCSEAYGENLWYDVLCEWKNGLKTKI